MGKVDELDTARLLSLTDVDQIVVPGSDLRLYQLSVFLVRLSMKANRTAIRFLTAAMADSGKQRRQRGLWRVLKTLAEYPNILCHFSSPLFFSLVVTRSVPPQAKRS